MVLFNSQRQVTMETMLIMISDKYIKSLKFFFVTKAIYLPIYPCREKTTIGEKVVGTSSTNGLTSENKSIQNGRGALRESVSTNWLADCSLISRQVLSYVIVSAYRLYIFVFASRKLFHCHISFTF